MTVKRRGRDHAVVTYTRNRACGTKARHRTFKRAHDALMERVAKGAYEPAMNVYRCKFGERDGEIHWHVGSTPGNLRKR